jgi:hypothetical protein
MRAHAIGDEWWLEFDGELYGPFRTAEQALEFDDREHTDEEVEAKRMKSA